MNMQITVTHNKRVTGTDQSTWALGVTTGSFFSSSVTLHIKHERSDFIITFSEVILQLQACHRNMSEIDHSTLCTLMKRKLIFKIIKHGYFHALNRILAHNVGG